MVVHALAAPATVATFRTARLSPAVQVRLGPWGWVAQCVCMHVPRQTSSFLGYCLPGGGIPGSSRGMLYFYAGAAEAGGLCAHQWLCVCTFRQTERFLCEHFCMRHLLLLGLRLWNSGPSLDTRCGALPRACVAWRPTQTCSETDPLKPPSRHPHLRTPSLHQPNALKKYIYISKAEAAEVLVAWPSSAQPLITPFHTSSSPT